jgi:hypothetical protein
LFKNCRDFSNFPPHARSLKSKEMIAVEPEKQRIVFTSEQNARSGGFFFQGGKGDI